MSKATSKQVELVRTYLKSIGVEISHVQALEVIARGQGYRSRHLMSKTGSKNMSLEMARQIMTRHGALKPEFDPGEMEEDIPVTRNGVNFDAESPAKRSEWIQRYADSNSVAGEVTEELISARWGIDNEHPDHPRHDWSYQVENGDTNLGYWAWVASEMESNEQCMPELRVDRESVGIKQFERYQFGPSVYSIRMDVWTEANGNELICRGYARMQGEAYESDRHEFAFHVVFEPESCDVCEFYAVMVDTGSIIGQPVRF